MTEWGDSLLYDNSTKCIYSIANDASTLYIGIKATDRLQQMKIIQGGMEIWIDDKAKKNKTAGIKFPVGGGNLEMPSRRSNEPDPKELRQQAKLRMLRMELTGFKDGLNGDQSIYSSAYIKPVMEWDDKENLTYELAVPFNALGEDIAANLSNISIGIFIKGLKMPEGVGGSMPAGGPPGGMPAGGPPGGMRPGGGGGRTMPDQNQLENMFKDNAVWTKYTISK